MRFRSRIHNIVVAGTLVLVLALTGIAGTIFAQQTSAPAQQPVTTGVSPTAPAKPQFGGAQKAGWAGPLVARAAEILKMKVEDVAAARHAGKSLVEIAKEKGMSEADLLEALVAQTKARLDDLVSSGKTTRDQADRALANIRTNLKAALNRTEVGPERTGMGPGRGPGMAGRRGMGAAFRQGARAGFAQGYRQGWKRGFGRGFGMGMGFGQGPAGCPFCQQGQGQQNQNPGN